MMLDNVEVMEPPRKTNREHNGVRNVFNFLSMHFEAG
jgi:hypothetical protein